MTILRLAVLVGCALLTTARIFAFSSDAALWLSALPSDAPRVHINVAAVYLQDGDNERALVHMGKALELAERPASAYEREAVTAIVLNQLAMLQWRIPVCERPSWRRYCSSL